MKKIKLNKELPFAKVGDVFKVDNKGYISILHNKFNVKGLIENGFCEEIKKETLANKIK